MSEQKKKQPGTRPDTSLFLGEERRAWLQSQGGIQPSIHKLIDADIVRFRVIEDNGGGLALFVYKGDEIVYCHTGYEYSNGALAQDIKALMADPDISDWDGAEDDPQAIYDGYTHYEYGWCVVMSGMIKNWDTVKIYPDKMGAAASIELAEFLPEEKDE